MRTSSHPLKFFVLFFALAMLFVARPVAVSAQVFVSVNFAPPAIPMYEQPPLQTPNDVWMPGYWAYGGGGYYWVPGTWVPAPQPGLYWTPGYWGWQNGLYSWNQGYWGPQVGYYGGVNYGYGYYGNGYVGGAWYGNQFRYNTAITRVNTTYIRNVFVNRRVVVNGWNRVSYNGGRGGLMVRPTQNQIAIAHGHRIFATNTQLQHQRVAAQTRANFSSMNRGQPAVPAVTHPYSGTNRPAGFRPVAAAVQHAQPHYAAPQRATPQHSAPQRATSQHSAPQHPAPQHAAKRPANPDSQGRPDDQRQPH